MPRLVTTNSKAVVQVRRAFQLVRRAPVRSANNADTKSGALARDRPAFSLSRYSGFDNRCSSQAREHALVKPPQRRRPPDRPNRTRPAQNGETAAGRGRPAGLVPKLLVT